MTTTLPTTDYSAVVNPAEGWMDITQPSRNMGPHTARKAWTTDRHHWTRAEMTVEHAAALLDWLKFCPVEIWRESDRPGLYWAPLFRQPTETHEQGELF